jgi:hypothetical protein
MASSKQDFDNTTYYTSKRARIQIQGENRYVFIL